MDYNPATGLPMINDGFDAGGNAFGSGSSMWDYDSSSSSMWDYDSSSSSMWTDSSSSSKWDYDSSRYHSCRLPEREYGFLKFISVSSIIIALIAIFS